jgi:hypothetical protein
MPDKIEIIKFAGEPMRRKRADDAPPFGGKELEYWNWIEPTYTPAPAHNPATHQATHDFSYVDEQWLQAWTITALTPEQIYQRYLSSLRWDEFEAALINPDSESAYSQLQAWASTPAYNAFNASLSNLIFALTKRSEPILKLAVGDLKAKTALIAPELTAFTAAQLTEINEGLKLLGVNWTWDSL